MMSFRTRTHGTRKQIGKVFPVLQKKRLPAKIRIKSKDLYPIHNHLSNEECTEKCPNFRAHRGGKIERQYSSKFYHKNSPPLEMWEDVAVEAASESRDMLEEIDDESKRNEMTKLLDRTIDSLKSAKSKGEILRILKTSSESPHSPFLDPIGVPMLEYGMEKTLRAKKLIPYTPMKSEILMGRLKHELSKQMNIKKEEDNR